MILYAVACTNFFAIICYFCLSYAYFKINNPINILESSYFIILFIIFFLILSHPNSFWTFDEFFLILNHYILLIFPEC